MREKKDVDLYTVLQQWPAVCAVPTLCTMIMLSVQKKLRSCKNIVILQRIIETMYRDIFSEFKSDDFYMKISQFSW